MALNTTNIAVTTAVTPIITTATTWANIRNAGVYDPISVSLQNNGATIVRVGGSGLTTATGAGRPVTTAGGVFSYDIKHPGDGLFAVCSASTSNVDVMADRQ